MAVTKKDRGNVAEPGRGFFIPVEGATGVRLLTNGISSPPYVTAGREHRL